MAQWKVYKFRELDELNMFLIGAAMGNDLSYFGNSIGGGIGGAKAVPSLVGKTLKFKAPGPAGTVTFVAGANPGGGLLLKEIKAQVEAVIATLTVKSFQGKLVVVEATPTNGVTVDKTGTANGALGFDINIDTVGKFYGSPFISPPVPPYLGMAYSVNDNMHVVYTFE